MSIHAHLTTESANPGRRGAPRYQMRFDALANVGQETSTAVTIRNLSESGLLLETSLPIDTGDVIAIHLSDDELIEAKVMWQDGEFHGCAFENPLGATQLEYARALDGTSENVPDAPSPNESAFGESIRRARMAKGLSATRLAELLGVSRPSLWAWETGRVLPKRENMERLAELVDLPIDVLLEDAANPRGHPQPGVEHVQSIIDQAKGAIAKSLGLEKDQVDIAIRF